MAIYQFLTFVLPKKSIEEKYGEIPKQLEIKDAEWEKYWKNWDVDSNQTPESEFEDVISTKWWKKIQVDIKELAELIKDSNPDRFMRNPIEFLQNLK